MTLNDEIEGKIENQIRRHQFGLYLLAQLLQAVHCFEQFGRFRIIRIVFDRVQTGVQLF